MTLWLDAHQDVVAGAVALVVLILAVLTGVLALTNIVGGNGDEP